MRKFTGLVGARAVVTAVVAVHAKDRVEAERKVRDIIYSGRQPLHYRRLDPDSIDVTCVYDLGDVNGNPPDDQGGPLKGPPPKAAARPKAHGKPKVVDPPPDTEPYDLAD